jgi:MEDS: MEthanogen/methylotroph, DcmR Sensory domain
MYNLSMSTGPRVLYQQGDHVCTLFRSREEQLSAAIEYIQQGLNRNERCLYVCSEQTPDEFRAALATAGIDVAREEAKGALILLTKESGHLEGGSFSPSHMISMLRNAVENALKDGFQGLCAAGDMTWLLDDAPGSEQLAEYEALLNHFYRNNRALGLCQYNRRRLPAAALDHGLATHPTIRIAGPILLTNPFYELPELAKCRVSNGAGVAARIDAVTSPRTS